MPKGVDEKLQPNAEDQVGILQKLMHRLGDGATTRSQSKRMILWKRTLTAQAGGDRCFQQLGQLAQFGPRLGIVNALPGVDYRLLGSHQRIGHALHGVWVWPHAQRLAPADT